MEFGWHETSKYENMSTDFLPKKKKIKDRGFCSSSILDFFFLMLLISC